MSPQVVFGRHPGALCRGGNTPDMKAVTKCEIQLYGDILSWGNVNWIQRGPKQNIKKEELEFETTI